LSLFTDLRQDQGAVLGSCQVAKTAGGRKARQHRTQVCVFEDSMGARMPADFLQTYRVLEFTDGGTSAPGRGDIDECGTRRLIFWASRPAQSLTCRWKMSTGARAFSHQAAASALGVAHSDSKFSMGSRSPTAELQFSRECWGSNLGRARCGKTASRVQISTVVAS
jgi:hypothetical protein